MKILLIRHAESENNIKYDDMPKEVYLKTRNSDPNITEKGRVQSEKLGLYLLKKKLKLKKIYCSAMHRSMETVSIVRKLIRTDVEIKVNIHEVGGIYNVTVGAPGKSRSWIKDHYPKIVVPKEVTEEGWYRGAAKETREEAFKRATGLIEEFRKWAADGVVDDDEYIGLVTHGAFMDIILAILLDRKEDSKIKLTHSNTGLTSLEFKKDGSYRLIYMNNAEHLEEDFSVLALEPTKQGSLVDNDLLEASTEPHRFSRSVSTDYTLQNQIQKMKSTKLDSKKELKTDEEIEDQPLYNKQDVASKLEKIDEIPEKVAK